MKKVLLVDGSNLARRNYHGQNLSTSSGQKTGAIYGVINSLISVQGDVRANEVVIAWDAPGSSNWRKEIYPMYKANRSVPEADYIEQREYLQQLLTAMGVVQVESSDAEADDIIGYLAKVKYKDCRVYVLSGDHDFYSLIEDGIHVISPISGLVAPNPEGKIYIKNGAKVIELYPHQVADYKCLVGDASDNISGAPGFGIGAAITFFEQNDGIDSILDGTVNLKGMRPKAVEGLMMTIPILPKFKELVTIDIERGKVPDEELVKPERQAKKVEALFTHFEFNQFKVRGDRIFDIAGVSS
jgi:DNA polymerase-1